LQHLIRLELGNLMNRIVKSSLVLCLLKGLPSLYGIGGLYINGLMKTLGKLEA